MARRPGLLFGRAKMSDKEYREMVREMLATEDKGFNNWEIEFLDDMFKRTTYTPKQAAKIEQIYEKKM